MKQSTLFLFFINAAFWLKPWTWSKVCSQSAQLSIFYGQNSCVVHLLRDTLLIYTNVERNRGKKVQHRTGFKPSTSWSKGLSFADVLQPLPSLSLIQRIISSSIKLLASACLCIAPHYSRYSSFLNLPLHTVRVSIAIYLGGRGEWCMGRGLVYGYEMTLEFF